MVVQFAPELIFKSTSFKEGFDFRGSFKVSGGYDLYHIRESLPDSFINIQDHALLTFAGAACNEDRIGGVKIKDLSHFCLHDRICLAGKEIVFGVTVDHDLVRLCPHRFNAVGVFF